MDYDNYAYGGHPGSMLERQLYDPLRVDGMVVGSGSDSGLIDPRLSSNTPLPWNPPPMQRFLNEPPHPFVNSPGILHSLHSTHAPRLPAGVTVLPPPSQPGRLGSPESQHPSSASSDHAPGSESDRNLETIGPSTPPNLTLSPRSLKAQYFESWEFSDRYFELSGLTTAGNACVNPQEISPNAGLIDFEPDPMLDFDVTCRGLSFSTVSSQQIYDPHDSNGHTGTYLAMRDMSPVDFEPPIKDEIHVMPAGPISPQPAYPSPSSEHLHDDKASESEIEVKTKIKDEDEGDGDWKPKRTHARIGPAASRTRGRPTKRPATTEPPRTPEKTKRPRIESVSEHLEPSKMVAVAPGTTKGGFTCSECRNASFKDDANLQKHIKQQHTRPFVCVFAYAGCSSTFASKNEWKRHVVSQHLVLQYWLCTTDQCAKVTNNNSNSRKASAGLASSTPTPGALPNGAIFNRKDLYTQHVRRMHTPPSVKKALKTKKPTPEWDERLRCMQKDALRDRCALPTSMRCPAHGCDSEFNSENAWDERMEHVARHLDKAATGQEGPVEFGGSHDTTLTDWAASPEVNVVQLKGGLWQLNNPLKSSGAANHGMAMKGGAASNGTARGEMSDADADADADGEEDD